MLISTKTKKINIITRREVDKQTCGDIHTAYIKNKGEEKYLTHCNIGIGWKLSLNNEDIINALIERKIITTKNEIIAISN